MSDTRPMVILTAYNMGDDVTDEDYQRWIAYVCTHIDEMAGYEVEVDAHPIGYGGERDEIMNEADDEQCVYLRGVLARLWRRWCAEG